MTERRRWLILADGYLTERNAKTAHGVIQYSPDEIAAVLDREHAGSSVKQVLPELGRDAPIVRTVADGMLHEPTHFLLGVATPGGWIPEFWRGWIRDALKSGLHVVSGLHSFLQDDSEYVELARRNNVSLWDVRQPPPDIPLFSGRTLEVPQKIVSTVGSDCAVGKKTTALELTVAAKRAGKNAEFIATGQTGVLIAGKGIVVDRVVADFVAGAAEQLVCDAAAGTDVVVVEGQGSLWHPAYSGVTLGLLHGSTPHAMVLCHQAGRDAIEEPPFTKLPPLTEMIATYESMASSIRPAKVAAISLNCKGLEPEAAEAVIATTERDTGLPVADVFTGGADKLWAAVAAAL